MEAFMRLWSRWSYISLLLVSIFILSSCGFIQRHPDSGYSYGHDLGSDVPERAYYSSSSQPRNISPDERDKNEEKARLRKLERSLASNEEVYQYTTYRDALKTDREKVEFLSQQDRYSRERYARARGLASTNNYSSRTEDLIQEGDVAIGMSKHAVKDSWGDPELIEVSGNARRQNERWKYTRYIASPDGFQKEERIIYFEAGRVNGWETR